MYFYTLKMKAKQIKSAGYSIYIGQESLQNLDRHIKKSKYSKIFILCDENTFTHCLPELLYRCDSLHEAELLEIESGEENKQLSICGDLLRSLSESNADRKSLLLNLGGGVIGDLGGFTASIYKRGIDFVNVPTTLLAMADASVGGKTAVDLDGIKNQIGLFSSPQGVFIYTGFLQTLPQRELLAGLAEIIKVALIADADLFDSILRIKKLNSQNLEYLIQKAVAIKNSIVKKDPLEKSIRQALNFGHTVGHALESFYMTTQNALLHGEAVALGMIAESCIAFKSDMISFSHFQKIQKIIQKFFGENKIPPPDVDAVFRWMKHDKKSQYGEIKFTLLSGPGKSKIECTVSHALVLDSFRFLWPQLK